MLEIYWVYSHPPPHFSVMRVVFSFRIVEYGDVRATLAFPFEVEVVERYQVLTAAILRPGYVLIGMSEGRAQWFSICVPETLQSLALAAFIEGDPQAFADMLRVRATRY